MAVEHIIQKTILSIKYMYRHLICAYCYYLLFTYFSKLTGAIIEMYCSLKHTSNHYQ